MGQVLEHTFSNAALPSCPGSKGSEGFVLVCKSSESFVKVASMSNRITGSIIAAL